MTGWIYEHNLDPVLVQLGPLRIGWYGLMYALAFLTAYWYGLRVSRQPGSPVSSEQIPNLFTYVIVGVIVGGRLGWVIFYGGMPYLEQPLRILETWKGGMSFHGGLLGVTLALWIYAGRNRIPLLALADIVALWVPVGLFLGRIGNFINGELYGMKTNGSWGVIFPGDPQRLPRHPTQLYEAFGEGVVIFAVLWLLRARVRRVGLQPAVFLLLYGIARLAVEFVRLPDADIGYLWRFVTMGQLLSLPMLLVGLVWTLFLLLRKPEGGEQPA